jgi:elongator complex protein 2
MLINFFYNRLCHYGVIRSLAWRQPIEGEENNKLQLASGGEDHSVRILNVDY